MRKLNRLILILFSVLLLWPVFSDAQEILSATDETKYLPLTLQESVYRALRNNLQIHAESLNPVQNSMDIEIEKAFFDPIFRTQYSQSGYQHNERIIWSPGGAQLNRDRFDEFHSSISKRFFTGTELSLNYLDQRAQNYLFRENSEYTTQMYLQLNQPLLEGFGRDSTMYGVYVSRTNRDISMKAFERFVMGIIHDVELAYWDLILARRRIDIQYRNQRLAEDLLARDRQRVEVGMLPSYELLETESQLALRKENVLRAENAAEDVNDRLKTLMNMLYLHVNTPDMKIVPVQEITRSPVSVSATESVDTALHLRPDLKQAHLNIERVKLRMAYVKDGILPSLNLFGSAGLHGFGQNNSNAHDDLMQEETYDWRVGVVFEVPFGAREGRYQYKKAVAQQQQALTRLMVLEQEIMKEIRESVREVQTDEKRISTTESGRKFAEERLKVEQELYEQGMSTTHDILDYQDQLAQSELEQLNALVDYWKSLSDLRYSEGSTLREFGIEFMEDFEQDVIDITNEEDWLLISESVNIDGYENLPSHRQ